MNESDLQRIEGAIGRPLSAAFRRIMGRLPPELSNTSELITDADGLIEYNQSGYTAGWPANQLALGDNGCGDVYSLDLDDERGAVYLSGPHSCCESPEEDGYFEKAFDSLPGFVDHLLKLQGGRATGDRLAPPATADEAWQRLAGAWTFTMRSSNSVSVAKFIFTPDRKTIRSSSISGGVLPMPMTNETTTDVTNVAVKGDAILLTLGRNQFGRSGGVMTVRLVSASQLVVEDGPAYTREG